MFLIDLTCPVVCWVLRPLEAEWQNMLKVAVEFKVIDHGRKTVLAKHNNAKLLRCQIGNHADLWALSICYHHSQTGYCTSFKLLLISQHTIPFRFRRIQESMSGKKTMAFFDPSRPIILRTEASLKEGLSAALLQKTDKGIQPVHFFSQPNDDRNREKVQQNRKRCICN
jgi:hypothetical protein